MDSCTLTFQDLGITEPILSALADKGFISPTPIQAAAIPLLLSGHHDVIGQAQTGTGKTAAFGIPILQTLEKSEGIPQALILAPTRELSMQIAAEMQSLCGVKPLSIGAFYGGQNIEMQLSLLNRGIDIVVGTPGRIMDLHRRGALSFEELQYAVLDEADEMLAMGFIEDITEILTLTPREKRMLMFSATMPEPILRITHEYQTDAEYIRVTPKEITVAAIKQAYYRIGKKDKMEALCRLLDYYQPVRSLIFCNTKRMVDEMAEILKDRGYQAEGLHGDLSQHQRDMVMNAFRTGRCGILIATDVAARGIDVNGVDAVFNYDVREDIEYYVHRIGRTGRAGKAGRSFTLVCGREIFKIHEIERICHTKIRERKLPSPKDITRVKCGKIFSEAVEIMEQKDLQNLKEAILKAVEENEFTLLDLAAAFMMMKVGEEPEEIREEQFSFGKRRSPKHREEKGGRSIKSRRGDETHYGDGRRHSDRRKSERKNAERRNSARKKSF